MQINAVDLFCGSGGFSVGLIAAGVNVVAAYDNWTVAIDTYRRNIAEHADQIDLSNTADIIVEIEKLRPDIIAGGPPCQDFSTAGKRIEGGRADLTRAFAKIVMECRPPYFIMENVPQVRLSASYAAMRSMLKNTGYDVSETVLDASYCGVPQARKRFFSFGSMQERCAIDFIESTQERIAKERMSVKEHLGDEIDIEHYYRHPRNYSRRSVFSVHEPSPTIRGVNRPVPPGYKGNHLDSASPTSVRPLTSVERSRIQTFPANWDWNAKDRNSDTELQIGNAVPPRLASFVAESILDAISA